MVLQAICRVSVVCTSIGLKILQILWRYPYFIHQKYDGFKIIGKLLFVFYLF
jgi:hypothetical protein